MRWAKARYLDASALVKLFVDEPDHERVRTFFASNTNFAATSLCVTEALGAIKAKWVHGRLTEDQYFKAARSLVQAITRKIEVDSIDLFALQGLAAVEALAQRHSLDFSDALQLETILRGRYSHLGPNSASVLVTADARLAAAATSEGIHAWYCVASDPPNWA